jgi:hypothetical protein
VLAVNKEDHNPDGWTFATLYKHFMAQIDAQKESVTIALASSEKARDKAEGAQQLRNEAQNEWRAAMKDQQATLADKESTERRLAAIEQWQAAQGGKSQGVGFSAAVIVQLLVSAAALATVIGFVVTRH